MAAGLHTAALRYIDVQQCRRPLELVLDAPAGFWQHLPVPLVKTHRTSFEPPLALHKYACAVLEDAHV